MGISQFSTRFNRIPKFLTGLTLLAFLVLVFMGLFDCTNPMMRNQMVAEQAPHSMMNCVIGKDCGMNINKHISIWQSMITAILNTNFSNFLTILLISTFIFGICKILITHPNYSLASRYLYYQRDHRESRLYNYFIHIFSRGILQPKLFAW